LLAFAVVFASACAGDSPTAAVIPPPPETLTVPAINREFRGLWVATVANIDWPSRSGLTVAAQQSELLTILDLARSAGLNAIVLQVRAAGDAIFPSTLEPWARSLTGTQGIDPGWDPLTFAVIEAHARGLELHAWFNPFRAGNLSDTSRLAPLHFARRRADLVRTFCTQLWFDPSEDAVQDQAISVVRDVVARFDLDAVHLDDFFYPYPDSRCPNLDFPDSASYARYQQTGGAQTRGDWRRAQVNRFIQRLYSEVHGQRNTVRVGISPFGIWRPGSPTGITGLDAYGSIYADSRHWLQQGWVDYFAPQLYWSIASTGQSFPALLDWWTQQNTRQRHLWPGLAAYRVADGSGSAFSGSEIPSQIQLTRQRSATAGGSTGTVLYNTTSLRENRGGLATTLTMQTFVAPALPPATTWLDGVAPPVPAITVTVSSGTSTLRVQFPVAAGEPLSWWLMRWRNGTSWSQRVVPVSQAFYDVPATTSGVPTSAVVVNAIDRVGNASADAVWRTP
ncbi:MAG: family 10 glycosylhydrolase, partial [Gemmatimonas sp.]